MPNKSASYCSNLESRKSENEQACFIAMSKPAVCPRMQYANIYACRMQSFKLIFQYFMFKGKSITGLIMYKLLKGTKGFIYVQCSFKDSFIKMLSLYQHYGQTVLRFHGKPQVPRKTLRQQVYFANYNKVIKFSPCCHYVLSNSIASF